MILENIWTFETTNYIVSVDATPEYTPLDGSMDKELISEVIYKLEHGLFERFAVVASVTHRTTGYVLAQDYLGDCIYEDFASFRDHIGVNIKSREDNRNYGSYFSDMVRTVVAEARKARHQLEESLALERPLRTI